MEVILAPKFTDEAKVEFSKRKNVRLIEYKLGPTTPSKQYVSVNGGILEQDSDIKMVKVDDSMTVTLRHPTPVELSDMQFGLKIVKHVKSNAIVVVKDGVTLGVGAGQMNRVGSAKLALEEARAKGYTKELVLASDGFLPLETQFHMLKNLV